MASCVREDAGMALGEREVEGGRVILKPVTLEKGEVFGKLTVLGKVKTRKHSGDLYYCGCVCGYQRVRARAGQLMKGKVKACLKCSV